MNTLLKSLVVFGAVAFYCFDALGAYKETKVVANGGTVKGKVNVGGAEVLTDLYGIFKDIEVCGRGPREVHQVRANGDAMLDVVVYLENVNEGKPFPAANKKITINQKNCTFYPFLSVMANGGELEVINSDDILHNIHTYELIGYRRQTTLNVSQPQRGNIVTKKIDLKLGSSMKVKCDAHNFMLGYVFVARNPYYAVVDKNGEYEIKDVPPGKYIIKSWHGYLGENSGTVDVSSSAASVVNFYY